MRDAGEKRGYKENLELAVEMVVHVTRPPFWMTNPPLTTFSLLKTSFHGFMRPVSCCPSSLDRTNGRGRTAQG